MGTIEVVKSNKNKQKMLVLLLAPIAVVLIVYMGITGLSGNALPVEKQEASETERILVDTTKKESDLDSKIKAYENLSNKEYQAEKDLEAEKSSMNDLFKEKETVAIDSTLLVSSAPEEPIKKEPVKRYYGSKVARKERPLQKNIEDMIEEKRTFYSANNSGKVEKRGSGSNVSFKEFYHAYVDRDEILRSGQTLHMRFSEDAIINNEIVPKGTMFTGILNFSAERADIKVTNIRLSEMILPTKIIVFDIEGNQGLYSPSGYNQETANETAQSGTNVNVNIPIVGSISKKIATGKIADRTCKISKNYKILIKDFSNEN